MSKTRIKKKASGAKAEQVRRTKRRRMQSKQDLRAAKASMKCAARNAAKHNNNNNNTLSEASRATTDRLATENCRSILPKRAHTI